MALTATEKSVLGILKSMLHELGLDSLASWAWTRYKQTGSIDLVKLEMEDRPEYKRRFAGRLALREQGIQMTEAEQIAYEKSAHDLMRQAGMPASFYNTYSDFTNLIGGGISITELSSRINDAFIKVSQAPPEVRAAMAEYYGAGSDSALAAFVLDQTKAAPAIMRQITAAETGGFLAQQGIAATKTLAERLANAAGYDESKIAQSAQQVGQWNATGVFQARFGEDNAATLDTGMEATFAGDQRDLAEIQRQQDQRAASGAGSSLGPGGLGTAQH